MNIYRRYGLYHTQQTRTSLRTLFALCVFLGDFAAQVFGGSNATSPTTGKESSSSLPEGDAYHPMGSLIRRLRSGVLAQLLEQKSTKGNNRQSFHVTTTDFLDVMDAIFRCPLPFPRGFVKPTPMSYCRVNLSVDPAHHCLSKKQTEREQSDVRFVDVDNASGAEIVHVAPATMFKLYLSGVVPPRLIQNSNVAFNKIIAWRWIHYEGQIIEDDDDHNNNQDEDGNAHHNSRVERRLIDDNSSEPFLTSLLPGGKFVLSMDCGPIAEEGYYKVTVELGFRDVRFGEWIIPTHPHSVELYLCVQDGA